MENCKSSTLDQERKISNLISNIEEALNGFKNINPRLSRAINRVENKPTNPQINPPDEKKETLSIVMRLMEINEKFRNENNNLSGMLDELEELI